MPLEIRKIQSLGDNVLLVQFDPMIERKVNNQVHALRRAMNEASIEGVEFLTPAYCELAIGFDPVQTSLDALQRTVTQISSRLETGEAERAVRVHSIPVCYDDDFGIDLEGVASMTGLPKDEVIACHVQARYQVYMLGFLPGFAYLGPLVKALECGRRSTARTLVPAQSVAIAGRQTAIYPVDSPGGWQIIGRTPVLPFDAEAEQPFLFQPGDSVEFFRITREEFLAWG